MRVSTQGRRLGALIVLATLLAGTAAADPAEDPPPAASAPPGESYHPLVGPRSVDLGHDLSLDLPADYAFLEHADAKRLLESMGNVEGDDLLGVAAPKEGSWIAVLSYEEGGYVKDDDADELDADDILKDLKEGTEEANKIRQERGFKPMHVDGFTDPPRYERAAHHLVWGIKGSSDDGVSINYYTRTLGRKGYVAINVIDDPTNIEAAKKQATPILAGTRFKQGARYEDFDAKNDKVAEYGLAALVAAGAGAAALKAGLFAKIGAKLLVILLAAKKAIVPLLLLAGASVKKFLARLGGAKEPAAPAEPPAAPGDPPA